MRKYLFVFLAVFGLSVNSFAAQIGTKFIEDNAITSSKIADGTITGSDLAANAVGGAKIRLENNTTLRGRNAANSADVDMFKLNASDKMEFSFFPFTPSSAPTSNYEVSNKKYVDDSVAAIPAQKTPFREVLTLTGTDITNQYVDSSQNCVIDSAIMSVSGVGVLVGTDVTLSTVSLKLRITFSTPFATGGVSELIAGDKIQLYCLY